MMTVNITNPIIERAVRSIASSHSKCADDIVQGALAAQLGYQELLPLFAEGQPISAAEAEKLAGC